MSRLALLRVTAVLSGTFVLSSAASLSAAERPNIVFIMADDLGYGDLGCYGQTGFPTPNIDRLAAEGMRFTDYYAGSTVCAPSRCVLMTGLHTGHCHVRGNGRGESNELRPEDVTVAEVLKAAGYQTGCFGKWGLGVSGGTGHPLEQGFDEFFGYLTHTHAHNYYPTFLDDGRGRFALDNVVPPLVGKRHAGKPEGTGHATEKRHYAHTFIWDRALRFVDDHAAAAGSGTPFFLYLTPTIPHANNEAGNEGMEIPVEGPRAGYGEFATESWPEPQKGLATMIGVLDDDVGRLLDSLNRHGLADNTIVFFTSDNGPHAEGGNDPYFFDSNGPVAGIKRDLFDGGIRVPMLVRWPGHVQAGAVNKDAHYHGDLMATAADLAGVPAPGSNAGPDGSPIPLDSLSMIPTLTGQADPPQHDHLFWLFYEMGESYAVRRGNWKAIWRKAHGEQLTLHDVASDVSERADLAADNPAVVTELKSLINGQTAPSPAWSPRKPRDNRATRSRSDEPATPIRARED